MTKILLKVALNTLTLLCSWRFSYNWEFKSSI